MSDWRQRKWTNWALLAVIAAVVFCLVQLGNWQLRRLEWKTALITAVETRSNAPAIEAPGRRDWGTVDAESDAYQRGHGRRHAPART